MRIRMACLMIVLRPCKCGAEGIKVMQSVKSAQQYFVPASVERRT